MSSLSYSITPSPQINKKRCPNGTRRNKKTGICEAKKKTENRCPNGTRRNKKTGICEAKKKIKENLSKTNRSAIKKYKISC